MAAGYSEMNSFMSKFFQLLHSGETAQLTLECYGGQFYVNLRAALPQQQYPEYHHRQQQVPSPSRLRRRARREAAKNVKAQASKPAQQATNDNTNTAENDVPTPVKKLNVAVQVTETSVTETSDVAVQTSIYESQQFEKDVPSILVGQDTSSCPDPYAENVHQPVQEQPQQVRGRTAEQAVHTEPVVVSVAGHGSVTYPHPHSPYPHKTHPGRYDYCCEHRCNTGRRRTNSGTRITNERLCCDHKCTS